MEAERVKDMNEFLDKVVRESGIPSITQGRLEREYPESDWEYTGDFCLHQETLFLHFADAAFRRMWWVRVDSESGGLAMTWDLGEISDLV
jgi:hypothetical protein